MYRYGFAGWNGIWLYSVRYWGIRPQHLSAVRAPGRKLSWYDIHAQGSKTCGGEIETNKWRQRETSYNKCTWIKNISKEGLHGICCDLLWPQGRKDLTEMSGVLPSNRGGGEREERRKTQKFCKTRNINSVQGQIKQSFTEGFHVINTQSCN